MSDTRSLAAAATGGVTLAMIAPPLAIGALLGLGLVALFLNAKRTPDAATAPTPDAKRPGAGWTFFDDEPAAPTPAPGAAMSAATPRVSPPGTLLGPAVRSLQPTPRPGAPGAVAAPTLTRPQANTAAPAAPLRPQSAPPVPTIAAGPRPPAPTSKPTVPQAPVVIPKVTPGPVAPTPAPGAAVPAATRRLNLPDTVPGPAVRPVQPAPRLVAPVAVTDLAAASPRPSPLFPAKIDAAHLVAVLKAGPLPRQSIVKALKAAPYHYGASTAYKALNRFAHRLETAPDGALRWKG